MNTIATTPTKITNAMKSTDYLYVKDLPDAGGLRAIRIKVLRETIEGFKRSGWQRVIVLQSDDGKLTCEPIASFTIISKTAVLAEPSFREVYDTTMDLASQFAEKRAVHW